MKRGITIRLSTERLGGKPEPGSEEATNIEAKIKNMTWRIEKQMHATELDSRYTILKRVTAVTASEDKRAYGRRDRADGQRLRRTQEQRTGQLV